MRRRQLGHFLRLAGPAIQIVCLLAITRIEKGGQPLAGIPLRSWLFAGFALGFILVIAGIALSWRSGGSDVGAGSDRP